MSEEWDESEMQCETLTSEDRYMLDQYYMSCDELGINQGSHEPGDTLLEAVCGLKRELANAKAGWQMANEQTQRAWSDIAALDARLTAVANDYETAVLREHRMDEKLQAMTREQDELREQIAIETFIDLITQRDKLADALRMITTYNHVDGQCDNGYGPKSIAHFALEELKNS